MTQMRGAQPSPPEEQARLKRQAELLSILGGGNESTQWIAIKELAKIGDAVAADAVFAFLHSESREVAAAARLAYRQMKERELLGAVVTADDQARPPQGAPQAPPPVTPPAVPPPPPVRARPVPPAPPVRPAAPEGSSDPVFTAADYGQDDGRTAPLPVSAEPFGAPVVDLQEQALLPDDEDLGLLPQ